jgi:hypothetical protein
MPNNRHEMKSNFKLGCLLVGSGLLLSMSSSGASDPEISLSTLENGDGVTVQSGYLDLKFSENSPELLFLGVDSLGGGKVKQNVLANPMANPAASPSTPPTTPYTVTKHIGAADVSLQYAQSAASADKASWTLETTGQEIHFISQWSQTEKPEPLTITFDTSRCHSTLLGLFDGKSDICFPAILHLPGFGTFRMTASSSQQVTLGYSSGKGWVKVTFPPASEANPQIDYHWAVCAIYPQLTGTENDPRFDGYRRNWLNIFQLNPKRRMLANNTHSDTCGFCFYEYGDIAAQTPPLADNLYALDMVRQSLDIILGGAKAYGMPGYGAFSQASSDTFPSLLIAATDYVEGRPDKAWLEKNYTGIKAWADQMLATDHTGDGLIKYVATGNSGSWPEGAVRGRPANWWDTIGFGYEDAYSNALAYRALQDMQRMATELNNADDAARFGVAAQKLHDAYFPAFFNSSSGLLAGWRSADGQLHDYAFTFVNSIAVLYGLVPDDKAGEVMNHLWDKMKEVSYTNFRLGLPGNLIPVARTDYVDKRPRFGGGLLEDNSDGFQVYENGGATACFSYFTIAAFDRVGQTVRADQILFPILDGFENREFEGRGAGRMTNDWRKWDGTAEGYEGFLTDNYYTLLAVLPRKK